MSKRTNLDIKDAACLHNVHNLQYPTSRPTTKSTQTTMVNAPKKNFSPLLAGRYGKSTNWSTHRRPRANAGKSGLEAKRVRTLGALSSLRSKKKIAEEKRHETHCLSNEEKDKSIEDYIEKETSGARNRVEEAEAAVQQELDNMKHAEITRLMSREPEKRFRQKQMKLDELIQLGWEDRANYIRERDKKYGTFQLRVPAVTQSQTNDYTPAPPPTTFEEIMESVDIVPGILKRPQGTSRPGSSHISLGSVKPQSQLSIPCGEPAADPNRQCC
jgi:hypothetical protein